jgi:hypothetical protein
MYFNKMSYRVGITVHCSLFLVYIILIFTSMSVSVNRVPSLKRVLGPFTINIINEYNRFLFKSV